LLIAVSLKMYFNPSQTLRWSAEVARIARAHPALRHGIAQLVIFPSLLVLGPVIDTFADTTVAVGAQDLFYEDRGPFTGAISGTDLRQAGCTFVEVGHAERRRLFGEDDHVINLKVRAAWRNKLVPLVCVGEDRRGPAEEAVSHCLSQLTAAIEECPADAADRRLVVAYEPSWAIGRETPANPAHIRVVTTALRDYLAGTEAFTRVPVIYGGGAGRGLVRKLAGAAGGLFLGRFAHDPQALKSVLDETLQSR
jgi:triosephosphate isomerase